MIQPPKLNLYKVTRGRCVEAKGPCEAEVCRYNLLGEHVRRNARMPQVMEDPCVLRAVASGRCYTLEEVGKALSVTRERARQLEQDALCSLTIGLRRAGVVTPGDMLLSRFRRVFRRRDREAA